MADHPFRFGPPLLDLVNPEQDPRGEELDAIEATMSSGGSYITLALLLREAQ